MDDGLKRDLTSDEIHNILSKFKDLKLNEHYDFEGGVAKLPFENAEQVANFIKSNKP